MKSLFEKILQPLSLVAAMILVSEVILAAVFYYSGAVTREKVADIVKVVQGSLVSPPEPPKDEAEAAAAKAKQAPVEVKSQSQLQKAIADWDKLRRDTEASLASEKQAGESMARELDGVRAELDTREKNLRKRTADFAAASAAADAAARDQGFLEAVKTYSAMEAKDVAMLLNGLDDAVVVRYLRAFKTPLTAEVLAELMKIDQQNPPAAGQQNPLAPGQRINRAARLQEIISGGQAAPPQAAVAAAK